MGMHLRQRMQRRIIHRVQSIQALVKFAISFFSSYRLAEFLPLTPLLLCLALLSCFPDWVLERADQATEWLLYVLLGFKCAELRDNDGKPTGQKRLYSIAGALDPDFTLPDKRLLCMPKLDAERELAFPSRQAAGWGNATFLAMCMKLAYEDWVVVRDVCNHEWRIQPDPEDAADAVRTFMRPRFIKGCSFHFMQPAGVESTDELSHIHLDSDACLIAVEKPSFNDAAPGTVGDGVALVLAFRGTEPLELSDFQSDFDAVPEQGEWGSLHPGFLLALGLDINLNPYHQTLSTYTGLTAEAPFPVVNAARPCTPYEVLRDNINGYMTDHPNAKLYVTGHSLGGALAVVFMGALLHDQSKEAAAAKARIGALYTFGQPRVGDYEFLCHLSVSLLEPSAPSNANSAAVAHIAGAGGSGNPSSSTAGASSRLRGLWGAGSKSQREVAAGPPLTSRYIRVVNTYDIVPHIPPTLCNLYQHGGDLLYLQIIPGQIKWLTEQPMFFISGIWTSSLYKLYHFGAVKLGLISNWKGSDNYIRYGMRFGAVALPFLIAGLNDHLPGDYLQQVANSDQAAWQPFRPRKKLSRWVNAVRFAAVLQRSASNNEGSVASADATDAASTAAGGKPPRGATGGTGGHATLSSALQAKLMQFADHNGAAPTAAPTDNSVSKLSVSSLKPAAVGAALAKPAAANGVDVGKPVAAEGGSAGPADDANGPLDVPHKKVGVAAFAKLTGR